MSFQGSTPRQIPSRLNSLARSRKERGFLPSFPEALRVPSKDSGTQGGGLTPKFRAGSPPGQVASARHILLKHLKSSVRTPGPGCKTYPHISAPDRLTYKHMVNETYDSLHFPFTLFVSQSLYYILCFLLLLGYVFKITVKSVTLCYSVIMFTCNECYI